MTNITFEKILDKLIKAKLIKKSNLPEIENHIESQYGEQHLSPLVQTLLGIGVLVAALCFMAFFHVSEIIDIKSASHLLTGGVIFVVLAIIVLRATGKKGGIIKQSIVTKIAFCLMALGKIMFVVGWELYFPSNFGWSIIVGALIVTISTYPLFNINFERLLSVAFVLITLFFKVVDMKAALIVNALFLIEALVFGCLFLYTKTKNEYMPITYATVSAMIVQAVYSSAQLGVTHHLYLNVILAASLVALIIYLAGGIKKALNEPLILASLCAVGLAFLSVPVVLLSICLMLVGYAKHNNPILIVGTALMPIGLLVFYYNLQTTLLDKSVILIGSGVLLLIGRAYISFRKLDVEV